MTMTKSGFCGSAFLLLLSGSFALAGGELENSKWSLVGAADRHIEFQDDGQVFGSAGCNRFFATYKRNGDRLKLGPVGLTKKLCEASVMKQEQIFVGALNQVRNVQHRFDEMQLLDDAGMILLTFKSAVK